MAFTSTQRELYKYCDNNDFISSEMIEDFRQRLNQEGNLRTLSWTLEKFVKDTPCPKCNASGAFKHHFLGKLTHPACSCSWYVTPGTYIGTQLKSVFRAGRDIGGDMSLDAEKKGEKGYAEMFFGFLMGVAIRLPFAVLMIPIQSIVSLAQKKQ